MKSSHSQTPWGRIAAVASEVALGSASLETAVALREGESDAVIDAGEAWVYAIEGVGTGLVKLGRATGSLEKRLKALQTGSPVELRIVRVLPGDHRHETELHERFAAHRVHGEWFRAEPVLEALAPLTCIDLTVLRCASCGMPKRRPKGPSVRRDFCPTCAQRRRVAALSPEERAALVESGRRAAAASLAARAAQPKAPRRLCACGGFIKKPGASRCVHCWRRGPRSPEQRAKIAAAMRGNRNAAYQEGP